MRIIFLAFFSLVISPLYSQILNGSFESWVWNSQDFEPEHWQIPQIYLGKAILKDTFSVEGKYALKLIDGGGGLSEGDCNVKFRSQFDLKEFYSDSLKLSLSFAGISHDSAERSGLKIQINGDYARFIDEQDSISYVIRSDDGEYRTYYSIIQFPKTDSILRMNVETIGFALITDGCLLSGTHWIDDITLTQIFDNDEDGYNSEVDCNDYDSSINPGQVELPYNGLDDDCNIMTLDDDLDQDGFLISEDCDDNNSSIHPNADDIPNNGIDEDCDGADLISSNHELSNSLISIYPNPATSIINIDVRRNLNYQVSLYTIEGKTVITSINDSQISVGSTPVGIYLLEIRNLISGQKIVQKIVIER